MTCISSLNCRAGSPALLLFLKLTTRKRTNHWYLQQFVTKSDLYLRQHFTSVKPEVFNISLTTRHFWHKSSKICTEAKQAYRDNVSILIMNIHPQKQRTLKHAVEITGIALHSGRFIHAVINPAPANYGIVFERIDVSGCDRIVPATIDNAVQNELCTRIENKDGVKVQTIEHFMAAFHGLNIDNLHIEIDGSEMPILDGSSQQITDRLNAVGIIEQDDFKQVLVLTEEIEYQDDSGVIMRLTPSDMLEIDITIDFDDAAIGTQRCTYIHEQDGFDDNLANARTFCLLRDVEQIRRSGMGQGGSLDNAVVVDDGKILNPTGLRGDDEFVRHKTLDCLGDLYLLGMTMKAKLVASRPGHAASTALLKLLKSRPEAFEVVKGNSPVALTPSWSMPDAAVASPSQ